MKRKKRINMIDLDLVSKIKIKGKSNETLFIICSKLELNFEALVGSRDEGTINIWIYGSRSVILGFEERTIDPNQEDRQKQKSNFYFHADLRSKEIESLKKIPAYKTPTLNVTNRIVQAYFYYKDLGVDLEIQKIEKSKKSFFAQESIARLEVNLMELEGSLVTFLDNEEYEKAAEVRDVIIELKKKLEEI